MMKKRLFILFAIYYSLFTLLNAAGVQATVSNTEIVAGNMAQLKIKATGDRAAFPNITEIGGAKVLGRHESQNNSFTYINGEMKNERSTTLVLTFAPQKDMTIPSYDVNIDGTVYKTNPIELKVVKPSASSAGNNKFSLQLRSEKKSVMVGEPFVVTVYFSLQNGVRLSENPQYNKPEFKGFFAKEVSEEKNYVQGNHHVTELRYILTPQSEGNFTVGPATAKIGLADRSRRDMFGRFFGTNWVSIASNTLNIAVKEKPQDTDLVGNFTIENHIDATQVKANKPVNLNVTISGEGSLEDFVFPAYEIDGVTVYSDDAKIETEIKDGHITSNYSKSFAFISDHDFTIPSRNISVYNLQRKAVESLDVPSYTVKVESGQKAVPSSAVNTPPANAGKVQTNLKIPEKSMLDSGEEQEETAKEKNEWWITILAFISGAAVMYLLRFIPAMKWKRKGSTANETEALKILYAHINESDQIEEMVRKLYAKKHGDKSVKIDKNELREILDRLENRK